MSLLLRVKNAFQKIHQNFWPLGPFFLRKFRDIHFWFEHNFPV